MAATRAPSAFATWIACVPMPPVPPCTRNVSPAASRAVITTFDHTVHATSGIPAAVTRSTPVGHGQQLRRGHRHLLGVPAAREQRAHRVADLPARDALAERRDVPRDTPAR